MRHEIIETGLSKEYLKCILCGEIFDAGDEASEEDCSKSVSKGKEAEE